MARIGLLKSLLSGVVAALAATQATPSAKAAELMPVNIGYYPGGMFNALFHVAQAKGLYEKAGLKTTFIPMANGPLMNSSLASGAIDFGNHPPSNVGLALDQGLDQVIIAGNLTMPWVLIVHNDVKLPHKGKYPEVIADLKGLNWGVYGRGSDNEMFMRAMAQDAKLDLSKDMTWLPIGGPPTGLPALKAKRIDVYLTIDPAPAVTAWGNYAHSIVDLRKGEGPANFKDVMFQGVVTLRKTAVEKPKIVEAMVKAHADAYCWINKQSNLDELVKIMRGVLPVGDLPDDKFRQMVIDNISSFKLTYPEKDLDVWNEMLMRAKLLKSPLPKTILWKSVPASAPKCDA
jgi:ABC-type nitrate/sulfonate/bicarbonate transport system substrate-binding protein